MSTPTDLETRFVAAIDGLDLPEVDLTDRVLDQLLLEAPAQTPNRWRARRPRRLVGALAALVASVTVTFTPIGSTVAAWFGFGATTIETDVEGEPPPPPTSSSTTPTTSTPATSAGSDATENAGPIAALGPPASVEDLVEVGGRRYSWAAGPDLPALDGTSVGATLSVRPLDGAGDLKQLFGDDTIEQVMVETDSGPVGGLWIPGTHALVAAGTDEAVRAQRVLLWVEGDRQYRLETDLPLERVLALAADVREN